MTTAEQALHRYVEAKNRQDVEAALAVCCDDYRYESVGLGGVVQGKEAARAFYSALFASLPDYGGEFETVAWEGDTAMAQGRFGGTLAADLIGIPVEPGRRLDIPVVFVCTFRDGLLASDVGYFDVATLAAQAGIPLGRLRPAPGDEFVVRFAAFWRDPDPARLPELVDPEVSARFPGLDQPLAGFEAYRDQIAAALAAAPDLRLEVLDHLADGDRVTIEWRGRCTVGGERIELEGVDRFHLRQGRASDARVVYDTAALTAAAASAA